MKDFSIQTQTINVDDHFREVTKMIGIGKVGKSDVISNMPTRYACYLIAQYDDPQKEEIAGLFGGHTTEDIKKLERLVVGEERKIEKAISKLPCKLKDYNHLKIKTNE